MKNPYLKLLSRRVRGRWRTKTLGAHGVAIVTETKNGLLAVQAGDFNVSRSLLSDGEYDWPQITWLKALLEPGSRLIFAGAHIGSVLVPLVRHAATRAVIAYEPSPRNFKLLSMNLRLNGMDGVVATNTTLARDAVAGLLHAGEAGGLSGTPVREASNRVVAQLRAALGTGFPIIGVGGILSAADARAKIAAGADVVQIYTGLIYRGPALVHEAAQALQRDRSKA